MNYDPSGGSDYRQQVLNAALGAAQQRQQAGPKKYVSPTQRQQQMRAHLDPGMANTVMRNKAKEYAQQRLGQYSKVADLLGGDFANMFHSTDMSDPLAAFKALSGAFTTASQGQGIQDPRMLLQALLMQSHGGGPRAV